MSEQTYQCRTLKRAKRCEKCNKLTHIEVKVVDRWAAWCGCHEGQLPRADDPLPPYGTLQQIEEHKIRAEDTPV